MRSLDTSPLVRALQIKAYRKLSGNEKADLALEISEGVRAVAIEGIKARHPDLDPRGIQREWFRLVHGDTLTSKVFNQDEAGSSTAVPRPDLGA
jgi:hypothetical protein